jgi:hypothetical protein
MMLDNVHLCCNYDNVAFWLVQLNLSHFKFWHFPYPVILLFLLQSSTKIKLSRFHILTTRAPFVPHPVIIEYVACITPSKIQTLHPLIVIPILEVALFLLAPPKP